MPPHVSDPFTGRLVVRLTPAAVYAVAQQPLAPVGLAEHRLLQITAQIPDLYGARDVLLSYPTVLSFPATAAIPDSLVVELERHAEIGPFPPQRTLRAYYIIDPRGHIDALETATLLARLQHAPGVELAYREPAVRNAAVTPADETIYPGTLAQHFDGGDWGINAVSPSVWGLYDGTGIGFADLESGWNLQHSDLPQPPPPIYGLNVGNRDHGAAVLGIVVGQDNGSGVVGIAPGATLKKVLSHIRTAVPPWPMDAWDVAGAILGALAPGPGMLVPGDVLLIEIETVNEDGMVGYPIETNPLWFDAIRLAVGSGIVVVEPAGNGDLNSVGRNLDDWNGDWKSAPTGRVLKGGDAASDSGAILVSGCVRAIAPAHAHRHLDELNYGSRVTCYAWGERVYSCGYGFLTEPPDTVDQYYTNRFRATSAASAIIAGAAILVQQMHEKTFGRRLSPAQMRALLGDRGLGTSVVDAMGVQIGVMPDLARIALRLGAVPDVYIRDSVGDAGVVPNTNVFQSPDIILRQKAIPNPVAELGEGSPTADQVPANDPVVASADNFIYVRLRNRSGVDAPLVTATIYWSEASLLVAPIDWHLIGQINAGTVAAGGALHVAGPFTWHPAPGQLPVGGHGCFVVVLDQALDPQPPSLPAAVGTTVLGWTEFLAYVGNNNNVAWRNFTVVETLAAKEAPLLFCLGGAWDQAREFTLELHADLPEGAQLVWELPKTLAAVVEQAAGRRVRASLKSELGVGLRLDGLGRLAMEGIRLEPRVRHWCSLKVRLPDARGDGGDHQVVLRQLYQGMCVGQLTWKISRKRPQ
jgi:serine protease